MRWRTATITGIVRRSPTVSSFFFSTPHHLPFVAGQHVAVRLTAPDGYRAQRSYSIASAPEETGHLELAIERLDDGEVSPFFHDVARVGDEIELSAPLGGYFIWQSADGGPILLVGGGAGIVPFMSMARHRANSGSKAPMVLLFSARTKADLVFGDELAALAGRADGFHLIATLTRETAPPAGVLSGRIDASMIERALSLLGGLPARTFICGSNPFVENAATRSIDAGIAAGRISTERYGV
jgi:glycine betaine catabolism B